MNGKTRSALRSTLKKEDAAVAARLPEVTAVAAETPALVESVGLESAPAPVVEPTPSAGPAVEDVVPDSAAVEADAPAAQAPARPKPVKAPAKPKAAAKAAASSEAKADVKPAGVSSVEAKAVKVKAPRPTKEGKPEKAPKVAKAVKPVKAEKPAKAEKIEKDKPAKAEKIEKDKPAKPERVKVVRDSFSVPKSEHAQLKALREALAKEGRIATKSELLRVGIQLLAKEPLASLKTLVEGLSVVPKGKSAK